jgi:hypothetical protein
MRRAWGEDRWRAMHITIDEAIAILDSWKTPETLLDVHVSGAGHGRKLQVAVIGISGTVVSLGGNEGETTRFSRSHIQR